MKEISSDSLTKHIITVVMMLSIIGVIMVLSASLGRGASTLDSNFSSLFFFTRQVEFMAVGVLGMVFFREWTSCIEFLRAKFTGFFNFIGVTKVPSLFELLNNDKFIYGFFGVTVATLIWAYCSPAVNNVHRWISIGSFRFQPGEMAKVVAVIFCAYFLTQCHDRLEEATRFIKVSDGPDRPKRIIPEPKSFTPAWLKYHLIIGLQTLYVLAPLILVIIVLLFCIELGSDMGTCVIITATVCTMLCAVSRIPKIFGLGMLALGSAGLIYLLNARADRLDRISAWLDPYKYMQGDGYQVCQSFIAIANGNIWGVGVPFSRQKFDFLPEMHCDFIYSIICEELGLVGSLGILLLFYVLCRCMIEVALRCKDPFRSLIALGLTVQIVGQALTNVAVVTGLFPNKGLPLPFISSGGSSLMISLMSMGLILNISDNINAKPKKIASEVKKTRIVNRSATISSSEDGNIDSTSSGEWENTVKTERDKRTKIDTGSNWLPRPAIEPSWTGRLPFEPGSRAERERLRRQKAMNQGN